MSVVIRAAKTGDVKKIRKIVDDYAAQKRLLSKETVTLFEAVQGNLLDERGRKLRGWTNKLIWGNNSLILSSLTNGPLRDEIEKQGGLKLVYIDPPFDVGDDFEFEIEVGKEKLNKKRNALEQLAFSDTWGKVS